MKKKGTLTDDELKLFHKNLKFMWKKLGTTHYYAKGMNEKPHEGINEVIGGDSLPSYNVLSKCYNDETYEPPLSSVSSIVKFYNKNIQPEIDTYQFLHEDLSKTANMRYRTLDILGERFQGVYSCLYPSPVDFLSIIGGMIKIYKDRGELRAAVVMGLQDDSALQKDDLMEVFKKVPRFDKFERYFNSQEKYNQRCSYYEGRVEVTNKSLLINFREPKRDFKKFVLTMNLTSFPGDKDHCDGGIAYLLFTSDGSYDTRFCKAGITNTKNGFISMEDDQIKEILQFHHKSENGIITLTSGADREWYNFILDHLKEKNAKPNN